MADLARIRRDMEVISSDGETVGRVASTEDGLAVAPSAGGASGPHPIPHEWVARVDDHVHLRHSAAVVRGRWSGNAEPRPQQSMGKAKAPWLIGLVLLAIAVLLLIWALAYSADDSRDSSEPLPSTGQEFNAS